MQLEKVIKQCRSDDTGKVKAIGVSNFSIDHIKGIAEATGVWPVRFFIFRSP